MTQSPRSSSWMERIEPAVLFAMIFGIAVASWNIRTFWLPGQIAPAAGVSIGLVTTAIAFYLYSVLFDTHKFIPLALCLGAVALWLPHLASAGLWVNFGWCIGAFALLTQMFAIQLTQRR